MKSSTGPENIPAADYSDIYESEYFQAQHPEMQKRIRTILDEKLPLYEVIAADLRSNMTNNLKREIESAIDQESIERLAMSVAAHAIDLLNREADANKNKNN